MIISIHIPRTAGTSFRTFLTSQFGEKLYLDYGDPILVNDYLRNSNAYFLSKYNRIVKNKFSNVECIHGHFLPYKYRNQSTHSQIKYIIWIRDPIDRLVSHYNFIKNSQFNSNNNSPYQKKVLLQNWSFEKFCTDNTILNLLSKFLWKFDIEDFDFVGRIEDYQSDLALFSKSFCQNPKPQIAYDNPSPKDLGLKNKFSDKIRAAHKYDFNVYEQLLRKREQIISNLEI